MEMKRINAGKLRAIGYEARERVLRVEFDDGTAIGSAIATSVNRLRESPAKSKIVILLTDGMNNAGKISPMAAAEAAKAMGVKVYTIAVGVRGARRLSQRGPVQRGDGHVQQPAGGRRDALQRREVRVRVVRNGRRQSFTGLPHDRFGPKLGGP